MDDLRGDAYMNFIVVRYMYKKNGTVKNTCGSTLPR